MKHVVSTVIAGLLLCGGAAQARQVCSQEPGEPRGCYEDDSDSSSSSSGSESAPRSYQPSSAEIAAQQAERERQQRISEAHDANNRGIEFFKNNDWANAVAAFQEAASKNPDSPDIRENLATAQRTLADIQAKAQIEQRNRAATDNMQNAVQSFTNSLNKASPTGGPDFDARGAGAPAGGGGLDFTSAIAPKGQQTSSPALQFGDASVVDTRRLPPGLSKAVDDAVVGAFRNTPPGVSDRVRKGFQAVESRDWKVAKAWFEDALNRDPGNVNLKRLIELTDSAPARTGQISALTPKQDLQMPDDHDLALLFPDPDQEAMREALDVLFGLTHAK